MNYVEVHPAGSGFRIAFDPPREDAGPFISNAAFIGPVLGELGVRETGPWEDATGDDGTTYKRAAVLG